MNYLKILSQCQFRIDKSVGAVHEMSFQAHLLVQSKMQGSRVQITLRFKSKLLYVTYRALSLIMSSTSFLTTTLPTSNTPLLYKLQIYSSSVEHTGSSLIPWSLSVNVSLFRAHIPLSPTPLHRALTHRSVPSQFLLALGLFDPPNMDQLPSQVLPKQSILPPHTP